MKLSENFTLNELTKSQEAIRLGIDNKPSDVQITNLMLLCTHILQPIRNHFKLPVSISSGYRSVALCEAIGSSSGSQHAKGQAADFEIFSLPNKEVSDWIVKNLDYDQCILEFWNPNDPNSGWIHCSYNDAGNRKQYLKASKENGKIIYSSL
ncbi:MAG: D-Ala-D-Ala carboxypeptidase family metallohydrolase [Bacteroidetes bacterium]|jgi:zinc D-Ala-D-Ala carboxypeptidase|nr:D-Ala-D-Ala carboxypeptidase family metallohydrolase [Bacteroidota bacterium]